MNRGVGPGASTGSARTVGVAEPVRAEPVEAPVAHSGPAQVPPTCDNTLTVLEAIDLGRAAAELRGAA